MGSAMCTHRVHGQSALHALNTPLCGWCLEGSATFRPNWFQEIDFRNQFPVNRPSFNNVGSKLRRARRSFELFKVGSQGQILSPGERAAAARLMAARECVLVAENPGGDAVCETWPADRAPRGQRRVVGLRGRGLFLPARSAPTANTTRVRGNDCRTSTQRRRCRVYIRLT